MAVAVAAVQNVNGAFPQPPPTILHAGKEGRKKPSEHCTQSADSNSHKQRSHNLLPSHNLEVYCAVQLVQEVIVVGGNSTLRVSPRARAVLRTTACQDHSVISVW